MMDDYDFHLDTIVKSYVDKPHYLPRPWLAEKVKQLLTQQNRPFILFTAEPGFGKSTFMAQLASQHPGWLRYFIRRDQVSRLSSAGARQFLLRLGYQLATNYPQLMHSENITLQVSQQIENTTQGSEVLGISVGKLRASPFTQQIMLKVNQKSEKVAGQMTGIRIDNLITDPMLLPLSELQELALFGPARKLQSQDHTPANKQLVILIDALDELHYAQKNSTQTGESQTEVDILDWLITCPTGEMPANVRFVLSSRPPDERLRLFMTKQQPSLRYFEINSKPFQDRLKEDAREYAQTSFLKNEDLHPFWAKTDIQPTDWVDEAVKKADHNLGYLDMLARGLDQALDQKQPKTVIALLSLKVLPNDLEDLYLFFLQQLRNSFGSAWKTHYRVILSVLAVVREPVSFATLHSVAAVNDDVFETANVLDNLAQFLDKENEKFRLYHATLPEFLMQPTLKDSPTTALYYVDPIKWHGHIADHYLAFTGRWHDCKDPYGWQHLASHIFDGKDSAVLQKLLLDFDYLQAKLEETDIYNLLEDFRYRGPKEQPTPVHLIESAIRLSAHILAEDKTQLAGQFVGRLKSIQHKEVIDLLQHAAGWQGSTWICPLHATLTPPGGSLRRIIKGRAGGHAGTVRSLVIAPDGLSAMSAGNSSNDLTVRVWDLETGICRHIFSDQAEAGGVTPLAIAPESTRGVTAYEDQVRLWDLSHGQMVATCSIPSEVVSSLAISADAQFVMIGAFDGRLHIWSPLEQNLVELPKHEDQITAVAISADGRWASSLSDQTLKCWDLSSRAIKSSIQIISGDGPFSWNPPPLVFSDDRQFILFGSPLQKWAVEGGPTTTLLAGAENEQILGVSSDGHRALSVVDDQIITMWDVPSHKRLFDLDRPKTYVSVAKLSQDGSIAITADLEHDLRIWDVKRAPMIYSDGIVDSTSQFVDFTTDSRMGIFKEQDGSFVVRSLEADTFLLVIDGQETLIKAWENRQQRISTLNQQLSDQLWPPQNDLSSSGFIAMPALEQPLLRISEDGLRAVSALIRMAKFGDHEEPLNPHPNAVYELMLWKFSGKPKSVSLKGHSAQIQDLHLTPNGRFAISGGWGRIVRIWDLDSANQRWALRGHQGIVFAVAITPDGNWAASCGEDNTVKLWDLINGQLSATYSSDAPLIKCWLSADGRRIVARESTRSDVARFHFLQVISAS